MNVIDLSLLLTCVSLVSCGEIKINSSDITSQIRVMLDMFDVRSQIELGWGIGPPCPDSAQIGWFGVSCNTTEQVTSINITSAGLSGTLPVDMSGLSFLESLVLGSNSLTGEIPKHFPSSLQTIDLGSNSLSGTLHQSMSTMTSLSRLNLSSNTLRGTVGNILSEASEITMVDLSQNSFEGLFPNVTFDSIEEIVIFGNDFSGTIPESLAASQSLSVALMYGNDFSGTLPKGFTTSLNLTMLFVDTNSLTGKIPKFENIFGNSTAGMLSQLTLSGNSWDCPLPKISISAWIDKEATSCSSSGSFWKSTWVIALISCLGVLYITVASVIIWRYCLRRRAKRDSKRFEKWVDASTNDERQYLIHGKEEQEGETRLSYEGSVDGDTEDLPAGLDPFARSYKSFNSAEGRFPSAAIPSRTSSAMQQAHSLDPTVSLFAHVSTPHTIFKENKDRRSSYSP